MRSFWKERDPRISELSGESASRKRVDAALRNIVHPPARPVRCMLVYCVVGGIVACRMFRATAHGLPVSVCLLGRIIFPSSHVWLVIPPMLYMLYIYDLWKTVTFNEL